MLLVFRQYKKHLKTEMPDDLLYETLKQNQKYQMIDDILDFLNYASESGHKDNPLSVSLLLILL